VPALRGAVSNDALPGVRPDAFDGGVGGGGPRQAPPGCEGGTGWGGLRLGLILGGNSKSEIRNPKEIQNPKAEGGQGAGALGWAYVWM